MLQIKIVSIYTITSLSFWIGGFIVTHILEASENNLNEILSSPLLFIGINLFFVIYGIFLAWIINIFKIAKSLSNYFLFGFIMFLLNISLDVLIIFPAFPDVSFLEYSATYFGYSLMLLVPIIVYFISKRKA